MWGWQAERINRRRNQEQEEEEERRKWREREGPTQAQKPGSHQPDMETEGK